MLQRMYYSPKCHYYYIMLMIFSILLVVITAIFGFTVDKNPFFILMESILNILIVVDYIFRIRMLGLKKYF